MMSPVVSKAPPMPDSLTILQRIATGDRTAAQDCIDAYGRLIWALARQFTDAPDKAETATLAIFEDIWRNTAGSAPLEIDEAVLIVLIARRRLLKR